MSYLWNKLTFPFRAMRFAASQVPNVVRMFGSIQKMASIMEERFLRELKSSPRAMEPGRLTRHEFQVYSQHGEDGVIAEIFRRIGVTNQCFVEVGTGNGLENNTVFLLAMGWRGLWVEGDETSVKQIQDRFAIPISQGRLKCTRQFVTAENIESILDASFESSPDLFSLDVDYNTYWVWKAIQKFSPRVVVIEYNAHFPPQVDWKVDYHADRVWDGSIYYGASLKALELLGREKGYRLVGCNLSGANAFFVREDLAQDHFVEDASAENHYEPVRHALIGCSNHVPGIRF